MIFEMNPIGIIHSPFTSKEETPIQPSRSQATGTIEILSQFAEGLDDLDGFSHIVLIYVFDRSEGYSLRVQPFLDDRAHGVFATRYPNRPNPLGLSVVQLLKRTDNTLHIFGVDVLDGTPLLDIKPYVPNFDVSPGEIRIGWYKTRSET
jgi:tRNA (adenine37-N6)-methyltransferase